MTKFNATPAQAEAIEARGSAVLVAAGAGSGKTKVLTERLMARICDENDPVDLDSFLIITFTRAAAGELRGRIMQELSRRLAEEPGNRRLRRQSALCSRAQIGTIHSFCGTVLKEYSHILGISPDIRIADDDRCSELKERALDRVLEQRYAQPEKYPGFLSLADSVGAGRSDQRLAQLVLDLHQRMQCHARPEDWAARQVELLRTPAGEAAETPWGREVLDKARSSALYWAAELDRLMEEMSADGKLTAAYMDSFSQTAEQIRELCRCLDIGWDKARDCLPIAFPRLKALRSPEDPQLVQRMKDRRDSCKKAMEQLQDLLYAPWQQLREEMQTTAPAMEALLELTLDMDRVFAREKQDRGLMDYSDLEHFTARLLIEPDGSPSKTALELRRRYSEIMVDEYQDVSRVQDAIFHAVSRDGSNLFLVGDVKQAIYRFRLADPEIFNEKYLGFPDVDEATPGQPRRILLRENFRSRREMLEAANAVFSLCMSRRLGDMEYDEAAKLRYGAEYYEGEVPKPQLMLLDISASDEDAPDKTILEARMTGRKIRELIDQGSCVGSGDSRRELSYGDIAILLRSANSVGPIYRRELLAMGIPVASSQSSGYFDSIEVSTLVSLLAVLDDPHRDIALIAVLNSPAFGFTADELAQIRSADKNSDLFGALQAAGESMEKCAELLAWLDKTRDMAADLPVSELVWQLMNELDLLALCSAMEDGQRRRESLMEMIALAERFQASGYRGLHRFVLWLEKLKQRGEEPDTGAAGADAVQIMSIHKSKGLEYPVVFLCDTARRFNRQDSRESVLVHPVLGLGPKLTDLEKGVEYPTLARGAIRLRMEREMLSEEMRLLYVALTRAKERFFVTAAVKDPEKMLDKAASSLSRPMDPEVLSQAASMSDWMIWAALADGGEKLSMSIEQPQTASDPAEEPVTAEERPAADPLLCRSLEEKLSFSYAYPQALHLPSKITATELKAQQERDEEAADISPRPAKPFAMPDFGKKDRPLSGAERGIATHLVLQYMRLKDADQPEVLEQEIERLEKQGYISQAQAKGVNKEALLAFLRSDLGQRILKAEKLLREFRFSLLWEGGDILPQAEGEELLLQGVVDCCIEDEDGLVVVDYKTDSVYNEAQALERAELYRPQISIYGKALERILGKPVKQKLLYFLNAGMSVEIEQENRG